MIAYVGMGGNIGSEAEILSRFAAARDRLRARDDVAAVDLSSVYRSAPIGPVTEQREFLNAVARVTFRDARSPEAFLSDLMAIEDALGRVRTEAGGPRTIDLDLLLFGVERRDADDLALPHPRMTERAFVLLPLAEIEGRGWCIPAVGEVVGDLLDRVLLAPDQACDVVAVLDQDDEEPGHG